MILIIGLGNPGIKYQNTRHNVGFIALDNLAEHYGLVLKEKAKFNSDIASGTTEQNKILLAKPLTYMNLSGNSVSRIKAYYNIKLDDIYVLHDDIDLSVGRIKVKIGGGNGGHNGLKSLDQYLGTNYHRIRIGVGRPENDMEVADYVLSAFSKVEDNLIKDSIKKIVDNFNLLFSKGIEEFKNSVNI